MGLTILLIDDHPAVERIFRRLLDETSYREASVRMAMTIDNALAILESVTPQIIFLDNRLPPYPDFTVPLEKLQMTGTSSPVVLMTGSDLIDLGYDDLPAGFVAFQSKMTLSPEALQKTLEEVLS